MIVGSWARARAANGETKVLITTTKVSFCTIIMRFVSLHDSDHDGVVRIFAALSCKL